MMNLLKIALVGTAAIGLVLAGTASAAPTRSGAAIPSSSTLKKVRLMRTVAPSTRESKAVAGTDVAIGLLAAGAAGFGLYEATKGDDSPAG